MGNPLMNDAQLSQTAGIVYSFLRSSCCFFCRAAAGALEGNALANIHPLGNVYLETGEYSDPTVHDEREDTSSVLVTALFWTGPISAELRPGLEMTSHTSLLPLGAVMTNARPAGYAIDGWR